MFDSYSDGPAADPPEISIVVPLFNEQENLADLLSSLVGKPG